ncbi:glutamate formimidoyltransferase [Candidatus Uabimicrobium amorphum]|uniref:Formimidoyltransferase-cyclodeaminase n=1 Tax=Uabimicrobium amorphum TaxID=2596890 RepID=A0A5S9IJ37_UABAM|nr:glutamate formimidoyltransferase [Candidatus Uabimicrobium amorphum]BBM82461.1 glutamate formiminotransferase [Candidatus Uabimicrobium amorphum]
MKLIECVPNFSEGRNREIIEQIVSSIASVDGIYVLHYDMDADHNRTVVTFLGTPENIVESAFRGIARAKDLINLNEHCGEHPRLGVTDVCPFIPYKNVTMEECVDCAQQLAKKVHEELQIPVYLYEEAAVKPQHKNLADIRLKQKTLTPDFGVEPHPTAGYVCIAARFFLIAYNINLQTQDVTIAKKIAKAIREKNDGLKAVKALAFVLQERNCVQVSTNLIDYRQTSLLKIFHEVERQANAYGVQILDSEIVGLIPQDALRSGIVEELKLYHFVNDKVIEHRLQSLESYHLNVFLEKLSLATPSPGGGSCAALTGATAAALAAMITGISMRKRKNRDHLEFLLEKRNELQKLQRHLAKLIEEDAGVYQEYLNAKKMPRKTAEEKKKHEEAVDSALIRCILVPLDIAVTSLGVLKLLPISYLSKTTMSDAGIVASQISSAIEGSILTIRGNLSFTKDEDVVAQIRKDIQEIEKQRHELASKIMCEVEKFL